MPFSIDIQTDNAAAREPDDLADLLESIAASVRQGYPGDSIRDYNGNRVGSWRLELEDDDS